MSRLILNLMLLLAALASFAPAARATDVRCVSDVSTFKSALAAYAAPDRSEDLELRVVQGTYAMGSQTGYIAGDGSAYKLSILGGYTAGCASRLVNPTNTVYDGQDVSTAGLQLELDGSLLIEGMTFTRLALGVYVTWFNGPDGNSATFRYNIVRNNTKLADGYDGVSIVGSPNDAVVVHDNLFYGNAQVAHAYPGASGALDVWINDGTAAWIVNNTIANNQGIVGLQLVGNQGTHTFFVYDNIVWNNYSQDIDLFDYGDGTTLDLYDNTYNVLSGTFTTLSSGSNKTGAANDPAFVNAAAGDYHLLSASTSINTGAASVPLFTYPSRDNDGGARVTGSRVDRGAFESAIDDVTNLVVSTTSDNNSNTTPTVGSIRWAIKQANANAGASTITFSTSCPTVFNLPGQLPDITSDVTIDGYHTAAGADVTGASQNTDVYGFNASLCPYLSGGGTIANAFRTSGSGRVTVTGIGFAGFSDAVVKLTTGSGHIVTGNQFGAVPFALANHDAIRVTGSVTSASIGDGTAAGYNWIADNSNIGVYIDNASGGVVVKGNVIGLDAGGSGSAGNGYGIFLFNSGHNTISSNFIDNSVNAGVTLSGISALFNVLQYNDIGINGSVGAEGNGGAGVVINAGAAYNTIGAPQSGSAGGNYIANNGGQGVAISGGGVGNVVLGNQAFANAGLAIDLGTAGPTANDALDADTGANDMQNFAVLTGATRDGASITLSGYLRTFANDSFRLDFYRSDACRTFGGVARGDARYYVGRSSVATDANGFGHFSVLLPIGIGNAGSVSAVATATNGDTSEVGPCVTEDTLLKDGFEF
jgi:trimeric autotransporter adhesin